ncbi:MAG: hypothetical protein IPK29_20120 [Betaproteobacteria bacterium]|nr:hypothetical protein [Betaproteobacteria bacterium]
MEPQGRLPDHGRPAGDSGARWRWDNNKSWSKYDNRWLAKTLNIYTYDDIPLSFHDSLRTFLKDWGPIWASGRKTWTGSAYGHVIVICGVADTGVLVYDPEPVGQGSSFWLTWKQLDTYIRASRHGAVHDGDLTRPARHGSTVTPAR